MAKIAIISDVHANKVALELVLKDIEKRNVDKIICLGDLVAKYYYPKETVDAIRSNCSLVIKGNCDDIVANDNRYKFARQKLGLEGIEYLDNLPISKKTVINKVPVGFYHANPFDLETLFNPLFDNSNDNKPFLKDEDYSKMFKGTNISIVGHTHNDFIGQEDDNKLKVVRSTNIKDISELLIDGKTRTIINCGSAGEHNSVLEQDPLLGPRPIVDPFLTYALIDTTGLEKGFKVSIIYVPYKEGLIKVYFDSTDRQVNEVNFPYSPMDTKKLADSISRCNNDPDLEEEIGNRYKKVMELRRN